MQYNQDNVSLLLAQRLSERFPAVTFRVLDQPNPVFYC